MQARSPPSARKAALRSAARSGPLYDRVPVPMHRLDNDGRLTAVSDDWLAFFGYTRDEVLGQPFATLMDAPSQTRRAADWQALTGLGASVGEWEYRMRRANGEWVDVLLRARAARGADAMFLGSLDVLIDITGRNRTEAQLRQAQKMEALGQLTGGVAHDFNNILQVIVGAVQGLGRSLSAGALADAHTKRLLDAAAEGAERGARLTHQLLSFARKGRLEPQTVALGAVVAGFAEGLLRRTLGPETELRLDLPVALWPALVDPAQLEVALLNLALNARDARHPGTTRVLISIEAANVRLARGDPLLAARFPSPPPGSLDDDGALLPPGDYVMVMMADNGVGMAPDTLARATEPFFTTKEIGSGTGLGLSQVYGFVRQSGGTLRIASRVGEGTSVRIYLPRAPDAASTT